LINFGNARLHVFSSANPDVLFCDTSLAGFPTPISSSDAATTS